MINQTLLASNTYASVRDLSLSTKTGNNISSLIRAAQDFSDLMQRNEETISTSLISGADPQALVQAIAETELAVETTVALRNKVVEAYQEILRMPV